MRGIGEMRKARDRARRAGRTVSFVPTMGCLHEGHLSLVDLARRHADEVVLSIYVNPAQFGAGEDLDEYPRDLERDLELAADRGVDVVFAPSDAEIYPEPQTIWVEPTEEMARRLCGLSRPTHFRGVLTVVLKLFEIVQPNVAVFGRKDYQQAVLIRRMVRELQLAVRIETAPIVRESDGVAMSSRNECLTADGRPAARALSGALMTVRAAFRAGERSGMVLGEKARSVMQEAGVRVEYAEIVDADDLSPASEADRSDICVVAGHVGSTRLIDNAPLAGSCSLDDPEE
ncbi:MAG: pantoate--beta-alanine ligase [Gemmatimonadota bacterium]